MRGTLPSTGVAEAHVKELRDKVAVVTGAASGFGRELTILCAQEGMRVVLADRDEPGAQATAEMLKPSGAQTLVVRCDVSSAGEVEQLAAQSYARFGAAHLLFNNAGVAVAGPAWGATLEDWKWLIDVNLMGVVHGVRSFVPRMLAQGGEAHVVNTASVAGLISVPGSAVYCVTKHAVVTLSECLHQDLRLANAQIGVSVLCPAYVNTGIAESARNRPAELAKTNPLSAQYEERVRKAVRSGKLSAADVARMTMDAVKAGRFYVLSHPKIKGAIEMRMRDILDERLPTNPMP
jgi:NAD(P)-dependent dehydrogenase (short-subunit alcohol dehydrogenase family)